jgi:ATP-binding cassette, subfamily B, bacterial IrtB/YbtQ
LQYRPCSSGAETRSWSADTTALPISNTSITLYGANPLDVYLRANSALKYTVSQFADVGAITALVGPSGSGKTTLTRLVARFWDVDSGTVRIGGADVRDIGTPELTSRIAIVFQDVCLFDGTIEDNVRLGKPEAALAELRAATAAARLDDVIARAPHGWDTRVGEGGLLLSGGERQRVSIARALLKDAPILLDETTSALDPDNENAVQEAIAALTRHKTVLVIAHRLDTIRHADRILFLEDGRIVEDGTHDMLLGSDGRYAQCWNARAAAEWHLDASA